MTSYRDYLDRQGVARGPWVVRAPPKPKWSNQSILTEALADLERDSGSRPEGENAERSGAVEGEARQSGPKGIAQPSDLSTDRTIK